MYKKFDITQPTFPSISSSLSTSLRNSLPLTTATSSEKSVVSSSNENEKPCFSRSGKSKFYSTISSKRLIMNESSVNATPTDNHSQISHDQPRLVTFDSQKHEILPNSSDEKFDPNSAEQSSCDDNSEGLGSTSDSCQSTSQSSSIDSALNAKELLRIRNKEHARNTRIRKKMRVDQMKADLIKLHTENQLLYRAYEDKKAARIILGLHDPTKMEDDTSLAFGNINSEENNESLMSREMFIKDILNFSRQAAATTIQKNALKLREIDKLAYQLMVTNSKPKISSSPTQPSSHSTNDSPNRNTNSGEQSSYSINTSSNNTTTSSDINSEELKIEDPYINDQDGSDKEDGEVDEEDGAEDEEEKFGNLSETENTLRKKRNRIHSMNTRERRKRFYTQLAYTVEQLQAKNLTLINRINELS